MALLDIDNFRLLNDNHGHDAGDQALLTVADVLEASAAPGAIVGRYGPDEFLVIAPDGGASSSSRPSSAFGSPLARPEPPFD